MQPYKPPSQNHSLYFWTAATATPAEQDNFTCSARPVSLKANTQAFLADFTLISASTAEQISSSSPELKHGIFSYYLILGMEGANDINKDGKITAGEMHCYLLDNVAKQASLSNRVQQP